MGCLEIKTRRSGGDLDIAVSIVCEVNLMGPFVRVNKEYIWLTESNLWRDIVGVESNTRWKAE